ncbi:MAG TPA: RHS repeat-associated core domain-containing protein [Candidatus Acidoferrales bacterium]|nr:RHS repeat-associated core domain-containing protein [Candidatus Acidoferrales bacterium]
MKILVGIVATLAGIWSMGLAAAKLQLEPLRPTRTWEFRVERGTVRINLLVQSYASRTNVPSLEILYENGAHPSLSNEARFLQKVLNDLPPLGVDPRNVTAISMRGFAEPEVRQRVAMAALHSKAWQSRATSVGGAERVVENLMNSVGVYDEFNAAFRDYGLRVKVTGVEKVSSDRCLNLKIPDLRCDIHHNPQLPTGANFDLALEAMHEHQRTAMPCLYDGADSLEEVDTTGNVLARYTRGLGIDQPLAEIRSSTTSYYEADGLGSITSLSNSSGALGNTYTYDSFGNLTASTGTLTNPLRYTAREFDSETGLYFYRARYYDSSNGRFLNEDPSWFHGGINFYSYVYGNPGSWIDPYGLSGWLTIYATGNGGSSMTSGHSWIQFVPDGGTATTYGTWGNNPMGLGNGLHQNLEVGRTGDASRTMYLSDAQQAQLFAVIKQYHDMGPDAWKLGAPCSTFSANAWKAATGERLNVHWGPISSPTTLKESIIAANGGVSNQVVQKARPNASSSADGSSGSSGSSLNWLGWLLQ